MEEELVSPKKSDVFLGSGLSYGATEFLANPPHSPLDLFPFYSLAGALANSLLGLPKRSSHNN